MSDVPEPERDPSPAPYMRLPMPVVAGALLVFLVGLLAVGLYANRNLRPQGIVVSTPVVQAAPSETRPAAAAVASTATAVVVPAISATATTAPLPLILVTPASPTPERPPTTSAAAGATAIINPTVLPTVNPALARDVGDAYVTYWRVRSQALLDLDATHLWEVMDGEYLQTFESKLMDLAAQGRGIKTQVSLHYMVVQADDQSAIVIDQIEDDSYYVKAGSEEALSEPANDVLRLEVKLRRTEMVWKVVESVSAD